MKRRDLMLLVAGAMTAARGLHAQQKRMPVIGFLCSGASGAFASAAAAFRQGLSETGYVEGQNVVIEYRWAEGRYDRLPALAADLVARKVDIIAAIGGTPPALAAKNATATIPIVFGVGDAVDLGVVASLAQPGGNLTGVSLLGGELTPKRFEIISELVPRAKVIALLVNPNNAAAQHAAAWHFGQCRLRQELYAICVWPHAASSQRATYPPSAAVRQRSIAVITFNWSRLMCPLLASRQAGP